jgi:hypothetical protein
MKEVRLKTIEALEKDIFSTYGVSMQEVASSIYKGLLNNSLFVTQMKQALNSKSSLYDVYKDNVDDLILNLIDPDKGDQCMLKYNLMCDDYAFYDKWRKELFDILYKELAGK